MVFFWPSSEGDVTLSAFINNCIAQNIDSQINCAVCITITSAGTHILEDSVLIKHNSMNVVIESDSSLEDEVIIEARGYCGFHVRGRKTMLTLKNITIMHTLHKNDKKEIGACVFALHQSEIEIKSCKLISQHGFAIWAVQRAKVSIADHSIITSMSRSGCVCFGDSFVRVEDSVFADSAQHGICLRGRVNLTMTNVEFRNNGVRSIYGYQGVNISLLQCNIHSTRSPSHAAIELKCESSAAATASKLKFNMEKCAVHDNAGQGVSISGFRDVIQYSIDQESDVRDPISLALRDEEDEVDDDSAIDNASDSDSSLTQQDSQERQSIFAGDVSKPAQRWQYHSDDPANVTKGWHAYSPEISQVIEQAYQAHMKCKVSRQSSSNGQRQEQLLIKGDKYAIDLDTFEQINVQSHYCRSIRRLVR